MSVIAANFSDAALYEAELLAGVYGLSGLQSLEQVRDRYTLLRTYYDNPRDMYEQVRALLQENSATSSLVDLKNLRNPAGAATDFYSATLWSGSLSDALPLLAPNDKIVDPIKRFWGWSNFQARKQVFARELAGLGDQFPKVSTKLNAQGQVSRVYMQLIDPSHVTAFDVDERDFIVWIRIDVPETRDAGGQPQQTTYTEVWDKEHDAYRTWVTLEPHDVVAKRPLAEMGTPDEDRSIVEAFGFDFIPIVHVKFKDVGRPRGASCFEHALPAIDEANRLATRLHALLFRHNKPDWQLVSANTDAEGKSLPPPSLLKADATTLQLDTESVFTPPSGWRLDTLVPPLNYAQHLDVLREHMASIEHYLLPELLYYRAGEQGSANDLSGRAIRFMLSAAIDRVIEARGNAEAALVRLDQMALTIGNLAKLDGFTDLGGSFDSGAFEHAFAERPVVPLSGLEEAQEALAWTQAGLPLQEVLRRQGVSEERITAIMAEHAANNTSVGAQLMQSFNAGGGQ